MSTPPSMSLSSSSLKSVSMEDLSLLTKGGSPKTVKNKLHQSSSSSRPALEKRKDKDNKKKKDDTENRESIIQEGPEGHQLYRISFSTPATCVVCDKYIWGMGKAGYECKECKAVAHRGCAAKVPTNCKGVQQTSRTRRGTKSEYGTLPSPARRIEADDSPSSPRSSKGLRDFRSTSSSDLRFEKQKVEVKATPGSTIRKEESSPKLVEIDPAKHAQAFLENILMEANRLRVKLELRPTQTEDSERAEIRQTTEDIIQERKQIESSIADLNSQIEEFFSSKSGDDLSAQVNDLVQILSDIRSSLQKSLDKLPFSNVSGVTSVPVSPDWCDSIHTLLTSLEKVLRTQNLLKQYLENWQRRNERLRACNERLRKHLHELEDILNEAKEIHENTNTDIAEIKTMTGSLRTLWTSLATHELLPNEALPVAEETIRIQRTLNTAVDISKEVDGSFNKLSLCKGESYGVLSREIEDLETETTEDGVDTDNLKFEPPSEDSQYPVVRAAAIPALIERLTFEKYPDMTLQKTFLLTFRSFLSPYELMEYLIFRYCITPRNVRPGDDLFVLKRTRQIPVRLRVLNVIKYWVDNHAYDFEYQKLTELFNYFMTNVVATCGSPQLAQSITASLQRKLSPETGISSEEEALAIRQPPEPIIPTKDASASFTFLDFDPIEVARQITLLEFALYKAIKPKELMNQAWSKKKNDINSPNVLRFISSVNKIAKWVGQEIVCQKDLQLRINTLKKMIALGVECFKLNNFNAGMEVLAGLANSGVSRLKKTWDGLDQQSKDNFQMLSEYPEKNYKKIREALRIANPPCVPYLGVYLSDLTFLEDGNPDRVDGNLINFWKLTRVANLVQEIQQFQAEPYSFTAVPEIRDYIQSRTEIEDAEIFKLSLVCEPRAPNPT